MSPFWSLNVISTSLLIVIGLFLYFTCDSASGKSIHHRSSNANGIAYLAEVVPAKIANRFADIENFDVNVQESKDLIEDDSKHDSTRSLATDDEMDAAGEVVTSMPIRYVASPKQQQPPVKARALHHPAENEGVMQQAVKSISIFWHIAMIILGVVVGMVLIGTVAVMTIPQIPRYRESLYASEDDDQQSDFDDGWLGGEDELKGSTEVYFVNSKKIVSRNTRTQSNSEHSFGVSTMSKDC